MYNIRITASPMKGVLWEEVSVVTDFLQYYPETAVYPEMQLDAS